MSFLQKKIIIISLSLKFAETILMMYCLDNDVLRQDNDCCWQISNSKVNFLRIRFNLEDKRETL